MTTITILWILIGLQIRIFRSLITINSKIYYAFVFLAVFALGGLIVPTTAFADVISPKKQITLGIEDDKIICKQGYFKVVRAASDSAVCVKLDSVTKLVNKGWAKAIDTQLLDAKKQQAKSSVGYVNKLAISKDPSYAGRAESQPGTIGYNYVFEVCTNEGTSIIRAPTVIVSSDSEVKQVKLPFPVMEGTCNVSAVKIKAANSESITAELVNKGRITLLLNSMEKNVNELKTSLNTAKSSLAILVNEVPPPADFQQQQKAIVDNIVQLRKDLNNSRQELNRYLFALNVETSSKITDVNLFKSFTGTPLEGVQVNKLAATEQITKAGAFDVVFEMCAGKDQVRVPLVLVTSDSDSKIVRLADKIAPNSCQVTGTKITATSSESITVAAGQTGEKSVIVSDLEAQITQLEAAIKNDKESIRALTHMAPRPADFDKQVSDLTDSISDLRSQIHNIRASLYNYLNQVNE
jgi:uncharacterized protein YihD (DUF1040 family)